MTTEIETILTNARWTTFVWAWEAIGKAIAVPYSVTVWGSNPDETDNDDCWTGDDFATNKEACDAFMLAVHGAPGAIGTCSYSSNWQYVVVDGPDVHLVAKNPRYSAKRARRELAELDAEWQSERAMQAGMAFGAEGYNDEMGW